MQRGNSTLWISPRAIRAWSARASGRRGAPQKYTDLAIETTLTIRQVFWLPLRQAEGFLRSLFGLMGLSLEAPDHTTLSRRSKGLNLKVAAMKSKKPFHLVIDSTRLSIVGEGEWATAKHGCRGKRGWRKLHLGVDRAGMIRAPVLTDSSGDDAKTGIKLIKKTKGVPASVTGDAAYDTVAIYDQAGARGARVVVPPTRTASVSGHKSRSAGQDRTILRVAKIGRKRWKKESGYHRQGVVENAFFRYKSILGDKLHARGLAAQRVEAVIGCKILNRLLALGRPRSVAIVR